MNAEKREVSIESNIWMMFIRGTVVTMLAISAWAIKSLISIDTNVAVMAATIENISVRLDKVEKVMEPEPGYFWKHSVKK